MSIYSVSLGQERGETWEPCQGSAVSDTQAGVLLKIQKQQPYGPVRKITKFSKGNDKIEPTQTQLQYCGAALDLCHEVNTRSAFWHFKSMATNLIMQTKRQHTEERVNFSCESFL